MNRSDSLPYDAPLEEYQRLAEALLEGLRSGDDAAAWRFKWMHPAFRGKLVADVRTAKLDLADAQVVVAGEYGFEDWAAVVAFTEAVGSDVSIRRFEAAVEAVIAGDVAMLRSALSEYPDLIHARSTRRHHATLLHYIAANGVEHFRQKTPVNAVEVARILLEAGAEVDAVADMYDASCTTMSMLVSSSHPAEAGLQAGLAETLLDYGAAINGPGSKWQSAVLTALEFGYLDTARTLARRAPPTDDLPSAAGLGWLADVVRLLPVAGAETRHLAFALAVQHGQEEVLRLLLDAGEDPDRYNPNGAHPHSTPLHQAVWSGHLKAVRTLVERGARLNIRDTIYQSTPLGWAVHGHQTEIAEYLLSKGASPP